jgi:YD repeat-containing protein
MYRYSYDDAGNLVQVRNDSQTQVLKSYTYSPAGLLATATFRDKDGNARTLLNTWDADSNRVGMNANGTAYAFVYDPTAGNPGCDRGIDIGLDGLLHPRTRRLSYREAECDRGHSLLPLRRARLDAAADRGQWKRHRQVCV